MIIEDERIQRGCDKSVIVRQTFYNRLARLKESNFDISSIKNKSFRLKNFFLKFLCKAQGKHFAQENEKIFLDSLALEEYHKLFERYLKCYNKGKFCSILKAFNILLKF